GGMAAVYEAEQLSLGKKVAVKILASELAASTIVIERFFREARAAASVKSPYIVDVYDSGRLDDGRPFIAMELLEGESLYDRMARVRIIDVDTTIKVIVHTARGLVKAHGAGIVHRDLKPENIFIVKNEDGDELAKLLDFGLAKFYAPMKTDEKTARLTREGAVFGTPAYMSPEQVKGQGNVDHRADLWALGCMAYECLIGRPVWNTDQGVAMTFAAIATAPLPIPSKVRPDLPPKFDDWFRKALERDPNKRFQSAKELADSLKEALLGPAAGPAVSFINLSDIDSIEDHSAELALPLYNAAPPGAGPQPSDAAATIKTVSPLAAPVSPPARSPGLSATEMPPTASTPAMATSRLAPWRYAFGISLVIVGVAAAGWVWVKQLKPQVLTPLVQSTATTPTATASGTASSPSGPALDAPKWAPLIAEGQQLFSTGDAAGAQRKFKEALEVGAGATARAYLEQARVASSGTGPCKLVMFSRPRFDTRSSAERPAIAQALSGPVIVWTDDHEQKDHDHAYSVQLDNYGRPSSAPRDVTPEATQAQRVSLLPAAERVAMLYYDTGGREAGVRARWLDAEGRIAGASSSVGAARAGHFWPSFEKSPEGFVVVWQDDRDHEGNDLFFRRLNGELEPKGPEIRLTDYTSPLPSHYPHVRVPSVAVASNAVLIAYKLERDATHLIERMRIPLDSPDLSKGLDEAPPVAGHIKKDKELGDVKLINEDKLPGDAPAIACGTEGCFVAWHGEQGGAHVALVEPAQGKVIWRDNWRTNKSAQKNGGHPALGVGPDGQVMLSWFEKNTVRMAIVTRDGVGKESVVAHVSGEPPRPWIAPAKNKNEWLVAWQDFEGARAEVEAGKVVCAP
ncbi:MAG TPA: serine/threonine-protein kinase, partial [Polyangiaceae bacterium]|nr:serine/threonine-protein kinase [Polyangiaceae bacterium]